MLHLSLPFCVCAHTLTCLSVCNKWKSSAAAGNKCRAIIDRSVSVLSEFCAVSVCLHDLVKTPKMLITYSCPLMPPPHPRPTLADKTVSASQVFAAVGGSNALGFSFSREFYRHRKEISRTLRWTLNDCILCPCREKPRDSSCWTTCATTTTCWRKTTLAFVMWTLRNRG